MDSFSRPNHSKAAENTPPPPLAETDNLESDDDEGPFFDLELTLPKENSGEHNDESEEEDDDKELTFTTNSSEDSDIPLEPKPQLSFSLLKSAKTLRIFKLALRKAKSPAPEPNSSPEQSNFFTKYKPKDVPIISLFDAAGVSKELVQKYLRKVRPLYVRMSKNKAEEPMEKTGVPARLRLVCERLGKCKSSSSAVAAVSSPQWRDDSLLMQQDGIQSAIAHCKRSFEEVSKGMRLKWKKGNGIVFAEIEERSRG